MAAAPSVALSDGARRAPPAGPAAFAAERPRGVYTSALAPGGAAVADWQLHVARLAGNMETLNQERPPSFAPFLQWCRQQGVAAERAVGALAGPQVAAALDLLRREAAPGGGGGASDGGGASGGGSTGSGADARDAMVVVVLDKSAHSGEAAAPDAAAAPAVAAAAAPAAGAAGAAAGAPLSVSVLAAWLPARAGGRADEAVKVVARGGPRPWAHAKHCEWVAQRRGLEAFRPADVAEVVLTDGGDGLLEGLVTNFFVVAEVAGGGRGGGSGGGSGGSGGARHGAAGAAASSGGESGAAEAAANEETAGPAAAAAPGLVDLSRFELQTACGPGQPVLAGVTQRRVLEAAAALGLAARLEAPRGGGRAAWREAFIANCIKGLQPVRSVAFWPDGDAPQWELQLPAPDDAGSGGGGGGGAGPVTRLLRARVAALQSWPA
ncbi:hypothetical protein Rsub_08086 [Raphidocelis subcapitata]|uniref:Uncharacterized protein n=1 Tax=Raphidocelis subcapitata TaxID=307507 RepID=A0A2V0PDI5_9CHLO|nr:hypothetical protein Rsub_08086 [Raphidocelis subcapitata]|eukprot:GBF95963.1 hypothetical protein Rsub_08086 [Raphidocelis subcapitata]